MEAATRLEHEPKPLQGKVAIVTGGTSGIGAATVARLAALGCSVASVGRDRTRAEAVAGGIPADLPRPIFLERDLADIDQLRDVVKETIARLGLLDILINNAGATGPAAAILDIQEKDWDATYRLNIKAPFMLLQQAARHMVAQGEGGRIVNLSSSSAFRAPGSPAAYATAKAAIGQLTRSAAADLAPHDINVNTVVPGATRTGMTAGMSDEVLQRRPGGTAGKPAGAPLGAGGHSGHDHFSVPTGQPPNHRADHSCQRWGRAVTAAVLVLREHRR
jgi:NAD(P)-dependent dehydrogenase (short-subunit alcohol dehydrogenase family)